MEITTGVRGQVVDGTTGMGMPGVVVTVVGRGEAATDLDGAFVVAATAGARELTVATDEFSPATVTVRVTEGALVDVVVTLQPVVTGEEVIDVVAKLDGKTESAALADRRAAVAVTDSLSAQEIGRTPASNAGDAAQRMVSVSLVDGRYVALRGLEGRYVTTLLNGVPLPSPEPDRNAVPLDLFPTSLLATLTAVKSYSAELPAQFGGGALLIATNSYPTERELKFTASTSAATSTTFQDGLGNASGGASDFFGFDDGGRGLPSTVPTDRPARDLDPAQAEQVGESFANVWSADRETSMPNLSLGVSLGDTTHVGGRRLGYLASASFRRGLSTQRGVLRSTALDGGMLSVQDDLRYRQGEAEATLGGLANLGYQLTDDDRLELLALYAHVGEDQTGVVDGYSDRDATGLDSTRLSFVERQLLFTQLVGTHALGEGGAELRWQANGATTARDELDSRDITYNVGPDGTATYRDQPGSGQRFFSLLDERAAGAGVDVRVPRGRVRASAGAAVQGSTRTLASRRFRYEFVGDDNAVRQQRPEDMFAAEHIGPDFRLVENTLEEDSYRAELVVGSVYASAELEATERLRAIVGVRGELATQGIRNGTEFAVSGMTVDLGRTDRDVLPAVNLVYALTPAMNLRAAASTTLVRPRFRELAPFLYFDVARRRSVSGNPELEPTSIASGDLRWEWFLGEAEVLAASAFAKRFGNPIEQVLVNGNDASFRNADHGMLVGGELEARVGLGRLTPALRTLRVGANLALMHSQVELGEGAALLTTRDRPMYGQSPYAVNVGVEWRRASGLDLGVFYNVVGARISDVGIQGVPDAYEQPQHRVDLALARPLGDELRLKASATNVLDQDVRVTQADVVVASREPGVAVSIGLEWTPR
ncbi:MAG: TonB-dependent receptor [Kofleriaceae bacterium]